MNRKLFLAALLTLGLAASTAARAQAPSWSAGGAQEVAKSLIPHTVTPLTISNPQVPAGSSICFTCGGDWPVYAGTLPTASGAGERGAGCAGSIASSTDTFPYLCSR